MPKIKSRPLARATATALLALLLTTSGGCLRMGPKLTVSDHIDYATAVGESWKHEALTNIVRMRYADWPVFTKIDTAVTNYTLQHQLIAGGVLKSPFGSKDNLQAFYTGKINENPRTIMSPLGGPQFVQSLLSPVPSSVVLSLLQSSGWSADRVLETMLYAVNGRRNLHVIYDEGWNLRIDPEFNAFIRGIHQAQLERALSIQRTGTGRRASMLLCFRSERLSEEGRRSLQDLRRTLDLSPSTDCYTVVAGNRSTDPETIAIQTRSVLSLLSTLGAYVEVPPEDLASGVAPKIGALDESAARFLRIHSAGEPPANPHVAVRYRDHWFWIDHTDADSKRTFAYLALLMNLTEAGKGGGAQLVLNVGQQAAGTAVEDEEALIDEVLEDTDN